MIQRGMSLSPDRGFGVIGDAQSGGVHHQQVVGAVTHGSRLLRRDSQGLAEFVQERPFTFRADDGAEDPAGESAVDDFQGVGARIIETEPWLQFFGEVGKSARDQGYLNTVRLQASDHVFRAGIGA